MKPNKPENAIGYIYITTNLINGKIYIGQHQRSFFDRKYYGSGKAIQNALKKYGKENFKVEILYWAKTIKRINEAEMLYIEIYDSTNRNIGYNISYGGEHNMKGLHHTEETKRKMRIASLLKAPVTEETKRRVSVAGKGRKHSPETIEKLRIAKIGNTWNKGIKRSKETRIKMGNAKRGFRHSEETKILIGLKGKGRKHTKEEIEKISAASKKMWETRKRKNG